MSYQVSVEEAVRNAGRLVAEGGAESVKLEGGADFADVVRGITRAGIPRLRARVATMYPSPPLLPVPQNIASGGFSGQVAANRSKAARPARCISRIPGTPNSSIAMLSSFRDWAAVYSACSDNACLPLRLPPNYTHEQ